LASWVVIVALATLTFGVDPAITKPCCWPLGPLVYAGAASQVALCRWLSQWLSRRSIKAKAMGHCVVQATRGNRVCSASSAPGSGLILFRLAKERVSVWHDSAGGHADHLHLVAKKFRRNGPKTQSRVKRLPAWR